MTVLRDKLCLVGKQPALFQIKTDAKVYIYTAMSCDLCTILSYLETRDLPQMSPDDENDTQRTKPWPGYFIVRTTGEVVPLIAVDELPPGTDLLGIPRSLDLDATIGMLNLGLQESSGSFYQICGSGEKETEIAVVNSKSK